MVILFWKACQQKFVVVVFKVRALMCIYIIYYVVDCTLTLKGFLRRLNMHKQAHQNKSWVDCFNYFGNNLNLEMDFQNMLKYTLLTLVCFHLFCFAVLLFLKSQTKSSIQFPSVNVCGKSCFQSKSAFI